MKVTFDDKSFIECKVKDNQIIFIISAKDQANPKKKTTNSVSITKEEFQQLISDII